MSVQSATYMRDVHFVSLCHNHCVRKAEDIATIIRSP